MLTFFLGGPVKDVLFLAVAIERVSLFSNAGNDLGGVK